MGDSNTTNNKFEAKHYRLHGNDIIATRYGEESMMNR